MRAQITFALSCPEKSLHFLVINPVSSLHSLYTKKNSHHHFLARQLAGLPTQQTVSELCFTFSEDEYRNLSLRA